MHASSLIHVLCIVIPAVLVFSPGYGQEEAAGDSLIYYDEVIRLSLQNSYEILISREEIMSAARQVEGALRAYYPKIRIQSSARGDALDLDTFDTTSGLILDWNPYQSGELLRRIAEAKVSFYIAKLNREQTVIDLVHGMQELYYDILKTQYSLEVEEFGLGIERRKLEAQEAEYKAGRIRKPDLLSSRSEYSEKELTFEKEKQAYGMKLLRLRNKIQAGDFDHLADVERNIIETLDFTLEDCINTAYRRQRGYITAKEHEKLAKLGVRYSKLKRLPTLSFFTTSDYALAQTFADDDFGLRVGLSASYPLYDAGETRAMIDAAESQYRRSALDRRKKKEETSLAVREKYFGLQSQMELLNLTREKEQRYAEDWESAQADFERGALSPMEHDRFRHAYMLSMNRIRALELDVMLSQSGLLRAIGMNSFDELIP